MLFRKINTTYFGLFFIVFCNNLFSQNVFTPAGLPPAEVKISKENIKKIIYQKDTVWMIDYTKINFTNTDGINFPEKAEDGKYVLFYENDTSKKYCSIRYIKNSKNGTYLRFYKNLNLEYSIDYLMGKYNGWYKHFYQNGKVQFSTYYIDGKENGENIDYNEKGEITGIYQYKDGKPHGVFKKYSRSDNGKVLYSEKLFLGGKELK